MANAARRAPRSARPTASRRDGPTPSTQKLPFVIQYNKRDLPNVASADELRQLLNKTNVPDFDAVARTGVGVFDTLKAVAKLVLTELKKGGGA